MTYKNNSINFSYEKAKSLQIQYYLNQRFYWSRRNKSKIEVTLEEEEEELGRRWD